MPNFDSFITMSDCDEDDDREYRSRRYDRILEIEDADPEDDEWSSLGATDLIDESEMMKP